MSPAIAVVGMACRYPEASSPRELWLNVLARRRSFRRLPDQRLRSEDYFDPSGTDPDRTYLRRAAVLADWVFDRVRFRVSRRTHLSTDLSHWLALEVADQALSEAGLPGGQGAPRDTTGVIVGNSLTGEFSRASHLRLRWPYVRRVLESVLDREEQSLKLEERREELLASFEDAFKAPFPEFDEDSLAGSLSNTIAGRICNHFDFHGGGYTVDGACASSLLAVAEAASKLASGDLDLAVAGGVDLSLDPLELVGFARVGALARNEMRVHDERPTGFLPGEGCGFVVLMRDDDARAQGRRVHARLTGWGISSDGSGGLTRPEAAGQLLALERAHRRAGVGASALTYVETHGTGTPAGDAAELEALAQARAEGCSSTPPLTVGSLKANIGHTKAAAGVAGLIKTAMALQRGLLPPSTGCPEPRRELRDGCRLRVEPRGRRWPIEAPRRAGVSAMGFGGINTHVVVEDGDDLPDPELDALELDALRGAQDAELLLFDASSPDELLRRLQRVAGVADSLSEGEVADLAVRAWRELSGGSVRAGLVVGGPEDLARGLEALTQAVHSKAGMVMDLEAGLFLAVEPRAFRIGLLFPGQGSPAPASAGLIGERFEAAERAHRAARLPAVIDRSDPMAVQLAVAAASLAGMELLDALGVEADLAIGHSLGELAALHWGGAYDPATWLDLVRARAAALSALDGTMGAMAAVASDPDTLAPYLDPGVVIACFNGPRETVLSGPRASLTTVVRRLRSRGLAAVFLPVTHAFHSPLVAPACERLSGALESATLEPLERRVISTVSAKELSAGVDLRSLLTAQLVEPVRFMESLQSVSGDVDLFVEVGAGELLSSLVRRQADLPALALGLGSQSVRGVLALAAACFTSGREIALEALFGGRYTRPIDIDHPPSFLSNPCDAALGTGMSARPPRLRSAPAALAFPAESETETDPYRLLVALVAQETGLPHDSLEPGLRLMADLHVNSLTAGKLLAEAARRLDLPSPRTLELVGATLEQAAESLRAAVQTRETGGGRDGGRAPAGLEAWVRPFTLDFVEEAAPRGKPHPMPEGTWRVLAAAEDELSRCLAAELSRHAPGGGIAACLAEECDDSDMRLLLATVRELMERGSVGRLLVVSRGRTAAAFARTVHAELRLTSTCVVELANEESSDAARVAREAGTTTGFTHVRLDPNGRRLRPRLRLLEPSGRTPLSPPIGPKDLLLVSGGGKGVASECALALARDTGVRLALMGRSSPRDDEELALSLARFERVGLSAAYFQADVRDAEQVRSAVARVWSALGPVTMLLHAAAFNEPRSLVSMQHEDMAAVMAPKLTGVANLLEALDPEELRLFVGFGSIIGRFGLVGEAHYAFANERLRGLVDRWQRAHVHCRCLCIEWSAWSGLGMAARLASIDDLVESGGTAISPTEGAGWFRSLVEAPPDQTSVVVSGRLAGSASEEDAPSLPLLRFLESARVHVPGVELIAEAELTPESDPYLDEHVFSGLRLFPAVMGLEAMAQAAVALTGSEAPMSFEDLRFERPITVPPSGGRVVRTVALRRESGRVDVALRSSETDFAVDHFRGSCLFGTEAIRETGPEGDEGDGSRVQATALGLDPERDLYGELLFQGGRFRRLRSFEALSARACEASLCQPQRVDWFGPYLPRRLVLPDPAGRDALLHAIQACHPQATLLPVSAERVDVLSAGQGWIQGVRSRESAVEERALVHDVAGLDPTGRVAERWQGLRLHVVEDSERSGPWHPALFGPVAERRFAELFPGVRISVSIIQGRPGSAEDVVRSRLGEHVSILRRADGRPEVVDGPSISLSHRGELTLFVTSRRSTGCDLEVVGRLTEEDWERVVGPEHRALVSRIAELAGEALPVAATRLWCTLECLRKADLPLSTPLVVAHSGTDGWVALRAGRARVACCVTRFVGSDSDFVVALLDGGD